jgi:hypothetical protein
MSTAEKEFRDLMIHLFGGKRPSPGMRKDLEGRELIVTPFDGAYGQAGTIIAVNGSPPRGVIVSLEVGSRHYPPAIIYVEADKARRLGESQARIVRNFLATSTEAAE